MNLTCTYAMLYLLWLTTIAFWQNLYYLTQRIWLNKNPILKILIFFLVWFNKKWQKFENDIHVCYYFLAEYTFNSTSTCFSLVLHNNQSWDWLKRVLLKTEVSLREKKKGRHFWYHFASLANFLFNCYTHRFIYLHFASVFHIIQATLYYAIDNKTICVSFKAF